MLFIIYQIQARSIQPSKETAIDFDKFHESNVLLYLIFCFLFGGFLQKYAQLWSLYKVDVYYGTHFMLDRLEFAIGPSLKCLLFSFQNTLVLAVLGLM